MPNALVGMEIVPSILIKRPGVSFQEIRTVPEAVEFLEEWPQNARSPFWYLADNAMQAAINGSISVDEARDTFQTFCDEAGILRQQPFRA